MEKGKNTTLTSKKKKALTFHFLKSFSVFIDSSNSSSIKDFLLNLDV